MIRILADESIPCVEDLFAPLGHLRLLPGRSLGRSDIADANVLLVRSVTTVGEPLLTGSKVRFVGTSTIGVDHLDTAYLDDQGICYASAPGCNALAVVQYVVSVLAGLNCLGEDRKAVVVGGGNVGSRVYAALVALGFDCFCYDPFLDVDCGMKLVDFDFLRGADVLCLHTPLTRTGAHPTQGMFDLQVLSQLKEGSLLINAGRGEVIDTAALTRVLDSEQNLRVVLDVWHNEPDIDRDLLHKIVLGTPHIAGYSLEGRVRGALMVHAALCRQLGVAKKYAEDLRRQVCRRILGDPVDMAVDGRNAAILGAYDARRDHRRLAAEANHLPPAFDKLRKHYPVRREFSHYRCAGVSEDERRALRALGFLLPQ